MKLPHASIKTLNMGFLFIVMVLLLAILFYPIEVLSCPPDKECRGDYSIQADKNEYRIGDEVRLTTAWVKHVNKSGVPNRYIECKQPGGSFGDTFNLGQGRPAQRPLGAGARDIILRIPTAVPGQLPAECHICTNIEYPISPFRDFFRGKHTESACSQLFKLSEVNKTVSGSSDVTIIQRDKDGQARVLNLDVLESPSASGSIGSETDSTSEQQAVPSPEVEDSPLTPAPIPSPNQGTLDRVQQEVDFTLRRLLNGLPIL